MNYLIRRQFTKENPIQFKIQKEIINSNLIPLIKDKNFREKKINFYITKIYCTDMRLAVCVNEKNLEPLKEVIKSYTESLTLSPRRGDWGGEKPSCTVGSSNYYESDTMELDFREFLEDITLIGLDLHQLEDYDSVKRFTVETLYKIPSFGILNPEEIQAMLEKYFQKNSEHYLSLTRNKGKVNKFWESFSYNYSSDSRPVTPWRHFYYNIILGIEPKSVFRNGKWDRMISKEQLLQLIGI